MAISMVGVGVAEEEGVGGKAGEETLPTSPETGGDGGFSPSIPSSSSCSCSSSPTPSLPSHPPSRMPSEQPAVASGR